MSERKIFKSDYVQRKYDEIYELAMSSADSDLLIVKEMIEKRKEMELKEEKRLKVKKRTDNRKLNEFLRDEARDKGELHYVPLDPCEKCRTSKRSVIDNHCIKCNHIYHNNYYNNVRKFQL